MQFYYFRKICRIITDSDLNWITENPCKKLQCLTVKTLYIYKVLLYVKNNLSKLALRKDVHTYNTRSCKDVDIPYQLYISNSYI